jgi:hypothetical protein
VKPTIRPVLCLVCARVWLEVLSSGIVAADPKEPSQSIELPRRISSGPPPVAPPPAVPAAADSLPPLTFSVTTTWQSPDGRRGRARQTVMRTVDRILLMARHSIPPRRGGQPGCRGSRPTASHGRGSRPSAWSATAKDLAPGRRLLGSGVLRPTDPPAVRAHPSRHRQELEARRRRKGAVGASGRAADGAQITQRR